MNTLITGSSGFIGSHLIQLLKDQHNVKLLEGDLRYEIRKDYKADIVIHLAGKTKGNYNELFKNNVNATLNVLNFCRNSKSKVIFASTVRVYGEPRYLPVDENHQINPINDYSKTKLEAEKLCEEFSEQYGIETIVLRLSNVYGSGQKKSFLIPRIIDAVKNDSKLVLTNPKMVRDYVYIDDVCNAFLKSIKHKADFEIFNISYNLGTSIEKLVKTISILSGKKINVEYAVAKTGEIIESVVDNTKAKNILGWAPKIDLKYGLSYLLTS